MAMRKIDLWKTVGNNEITGDDRLEVDPLDVLYFNRQTKFFNSEDEREHDKHIKALCKSEDELKATLSNEQQYLYDVVSCNSLQVLGVGCMSSYKHGVRDGFLLMFNLVHKAGLDDLENALSELKDKVLNLAK